tara:strand:- start:667 stop:1011 length:345 start_codon:yes stop_codon:yes gene_type:complete
MAVLNFRKTKKQTVKNIKQLCTPAFVYLAISLISLLIMLIQNFGNSDVFCIASYDCAVSSTIGVFVVHVMYIAVWTWLLNVICKSGNTNIAWFLVLLPYLIFLLFIIFLVIKLH